MARPNGYDVDGYIHYITKRNSSLLDSTVEKNEVNDREMFEVDFELIEKLNLNKVGNEVPFTNNVVNLERYMMYYWKAIMDSDCVILYLHLWEYARRDDGIDIIYPKFKELQERFQTSRPTLLSKLKKLEENNFLIVVHRLNKKNGNKEDSPIIKLRRTIPLLTRQQYYKLTPYLQKKHDQYMERFASDTQMVVFERDSISQQKEAMVKDYGDRIVTKKMRVEIEKNMFDVEAEEYILEHLPSAIRKTLISEAELQKMFIDGQYVSKPSSEFYFKDAMCFYEEETSTVFLIFKSKEHREFMDKVILEKQLETFICAFETRYEEVYSIRTYTRVQFMVDVLKGK